MTTFAHTSLGQINHMLSFHHKDKKLQFYHVVQMLKSLGMLSDLDSSHTLNWWASSELGKSLDR